MKVNIQEHMMLTIILVFTFEEMKGKMIKWLLLSHKMNQYRY